MDVEMKQLMDEIMDKMHQISWWFMELEKKEIDGITIKPEQIQSNPAINTLFESVQKDYRKLQELIEDSAKNNRKRYIENNSIKTQEQIEEELVNELINYQQEGAMRLRYASSYVVENGSKGKQKKYYPSIYEGTPYAKIMDAENAVHVYNIKNIKLRIDSLRNPEKFSFKDKSDILEQISLNQFHKDYVFRTIDSLIGISPIYRKEMNNYQHNLLRESLIEQKYLRHYLNINSKYNGFIQENDIGKFKLVKGYIKEEIIPTVFGMTEYEYVANKEENESVFMQRFNDEIIEITGRSISEFATHAEELLDKHENEKNEIKQVKPQVYIVGRESKTVKKENEGKEEK